MSNIIDTIQVSGVTYTIAGSGSGNSVVEVTQAQYDSLVSGGTVDPTVLYIITDAQAGDLTQYWTSAQTQSAITAAVSGKASQSDLETVSGQVANKQDTLSAGTGIDITNNVISATGGGGGGKAIEAGRGISITTGETADTISVSLPISAGTGADSIIGGRTNTVAPVASFAFGENNLIYYDSAYSSILGYNNKIYNGSSAAHIVGSNNEVRNSSECAVGKYNTSSTGSTDSDKSLFSVGNGTADNARHNAFEIRRNGDIYLTLNGQDVKLQDILLQLSGSTA